MTTSYTVIWSGDEAGLYRREAGSHIDHLVADWWALWKSGYDVLRILHWKQESLARVAREMESR